MGEFIYKVSLKPIGAYFFGGEKTFSFGENDDNTKSPYYIISENTPSQTTLFGALRYMILEKANALRGCDNAKNAGDLVGIDSFDLESEDEQSFGKIVSISPLFIEKKEKDKNQIFFKTPMSYFEGKDDSGNVVCDWITLSEDNDIINGDNVKLFPYFNGHLVDAKKFPTGGYMDTDGNLFKDDEALFEDDIRVGINARRNQCNMDDEDCFYKKVYKRLNKKCSFVFYAHINEEAGEEVLNERSIVYLGQNKSTFTVKAEKVDNGENEIYEKIGALGNHGNYDKSSVKCFLAMSDCRFNKEFDCNFKITSTKYFHYLKSYMTKKTYYDRLKKETNSYELTESGSVFWTEKNLQNSGEMFYSQKAQIIGMNILIQIGKPSIDNKTLTQ